MKESTTGSNLLKKAVFVVLFSIVLYIPLLFINTIVHERSNRSTQAAEDIFKSLGKEQKIFGPFLMVSYYEEEWSPKKTMVILPDEVNTDIILKNDERKRGIHKAIAYNGNLKIKGTFSEALKNIPQDASIDTDNITMALAISDSTSEYDNVNFLFNNEKIDVKSGLLFQNEFILEDDPFLHIKNGIYGKLKNISSELSEIKFDLNVDFRGSKRLEVVPSGENNNFTIESDWKDPSFFGILPDNRTIDKKAGFKADWSINPISSEYNQFFSIDKEVSYFQEKSVGVRLFNTVTHYTQVIRAIKYGGLFIMLSLMAAFLFDLASKKSALYIQYGIVGFSLVMFYLLLLSLSEHIIFEKAYIIATVAVVIPIAFYIYGITKRKAFGLGMFLALSVIYFILFVILKMSEYAFLTGSWLLMIVVYIIMYVTRNINNKEEI